MPAATEIAKLKREIASLAEIVGAGRGSGRAPLGPAERRALKSELDWCIRELDELRTRLSG